MFFGKNISSIISTLLLLLITNVLGNQILTSDLIERDASLLSSALFNKLKEAPLSHHGKEYIDNGNPNHIANKIFASFGEKYIPIFESIVKQYLNDNPNAKIPKLSVSHQMIPMRDGKKLSTIIVVPEIFEDGENNQQKKVGTMVSRSPYGPTSDAIAIVYTIMNGFAAIIQDQRGTFLSEGDFTLWQLDAEDGYDTIEWVVKQPWSNGKTFMFGISADGCGALTEMRMKGVDKHLKGQMIMLSNADGHETTYPGGAFREGLITGWMTVQSILTKGHSLKSTLPEILKNQKLGPYWYPIQAEHPGSDNYPNIKWPMVWYAGWADIFLGMQTDNFDQLITRSDKSVRDHHKLVIGPLGHCIFGSEYHPGLLKEEVLGIVNSVGYSSELFQHEVDNDGDLNIPSGTGKYAKRLKRFNFYVHGPAKRPGQNLRGVDSDSQIGHYWTSLDSWPKTKPTRLYISLSNQLLTKQLSEGTTGSQGIREFIYDPLNPLLTHGGNNFVLIFLGMGCGSMKQNDMENRKDVLMWTTPEPLKEPVAITGKVRAHLYVSSNRNDTDFFVTVHDVHPNGDSFNVVSGLRRMKWRTSTVKESIESEPMKPDTIYEVDIDLWRTSHIFAAGHKIRVAITSSNTPYYAKNDDSGKDDDVLGMKKNLVASNRIHWSASAPSYVELPIVDLKDIPRNDNFYG